MSNEKEIKINKETLGRWISYVSENLDYAIDGSNGDLLEDLYKEMQELYVNAN